MRPLLLASLLVGTGCIAPGQLRKDLQTTESLIEATRGLHPTQCAPEVFADAEVELSFARLEVHQGNARGASEHIERSLALAKAAHAHSVACGTSDTDGDTISDVVDRCPEEPEDVDGDADLDGCPELDPGGDEDRDGITNLDDDCLMEPEDFDGHHDDDGCPETSDDTDGDGIIDLNDQCPGEAEDADGFKDHDGCPDNDNDLDGLVDVRDACVSSPEDLDGWEDDDGCPDNDNDGDGLHDLDDNCPDHVGPPEHKGCPADDRDADGLADAVDACPDAPEVRNGHLDDDGCPDEAARVRITRTRIELTEPITFLEGSSQLTPSALVLVSEVIAVLEQLPSVRVRIEGHTDAQGDEDANVALSRRRAEMVFDAFVDEGLEAERFDVVGYGGSRPIDTNRTSSGRERNRRIELHLLR